MKKITDPEYKYAVEGLGDLPETNWEIFKAVCKSFGLGACIILALCFTVSLSTGLVALAVKIVTYAQNVAGGI